MIPARIGLPAAICVAMFGKRPEMEKLLQFYGGPARHSNTIGHVVHQTESDEKFFIKQAAQAGESVRLLFSERSDLLVELYDRMDGLEMRTRDRQTDRSWR